MAIAWARLFTLPPLPPGPPLSVPRLCRRIALATVFEAPLEYLRAATFQIPFDVREDNGPTRTMFRVHYPTSNEE